MFRETVETMIGDNKWPVAWQCPHIPSIHSFFLFPFSSFFFANGERFFLMISDELEFMGRRSKADNHRIWFND